MEHLLFALNKDQAMQKPEPLHKEPCCFVFYMFM